MPQALHDRYTGVDKNIEPKTVLTISHLTFFAVGVLIGLTIYLHPGGSAACLIALVMAIILLNRPFVRDHKYTKDPETPNEEDHTMNQTAAKMVPSKEVIDSGNVAVLRVVPQVFPSEPSLLLQKANVLAIGQDVAVGSPYKEKQNSVASSTQSSDVPTEWLAQAPAPVPLEQYVQGKDTALPKDEAEDVHRGSEPFAEVALLGELTRDQQGAVTTSDSPAADSQVTEVVSLVDSALNGQSISNSHVGDTVPNSPLQDEAPENEVHHRNFRFREHSNQYEDAPWALTDTFPAPSMIDIPDFIEERTKRTFEERRLIIWGLIKMAESGDVHDNLLFQSSGKGQYFTLLPDRLSTVPLQRVHIGPLAIPDEVADTPCSELDVVGLLRELNVVMGTRYALGQPGLQASLRYIMKECSDFGKVYGVVRPWWGNPYFSKELARRKRRDREMRQHATAGQSIKTHSVPPRRVWDLYSNRVVPFSALPDPNRRDTIPENLWAVSHSWVEVKDRVEVSTNINGRRWPVPIPHDTTLSNVRIELLNLGAEYAWLDVLCLRQRGHENKRDESQRKEEWKLDVPTIGFVYSHSPSPVCVTYFNGLGRPFDVSSKVLKSDRHWRNRVWTLQELCDLWLPGGMTGSQLPGIRHFFINLDHDLRKVGSWDLHGLFSILRARCCSREVDRVAGLAYILGCQTLPIYDEDTPVESAWERLITHMPPWIRTLIFLQYSPELPSQLFPSWKHFIETNPEVQSASSSIPPKESLKLLDESQLQTRDTAALKYFHHGYAIGPCYIRRNLHHRVNSMEDVYLRFDSGDSQAQVGIKASVSGTILSETSYTLIGIQQMRYWVVAEVLEERYEGGERLLEAVKWGIMHMTLAEGKRIKELRLGHLGTKVVYVSGKET